jgi:putative chitinase
MIKLLDVAKNYKGFPHQIKALEILDNILASSYSDLVKDNQYWVNVWRTPDEPVNNSSTPESLKINNESIDWYNPDAQVSKYFVVADVTQQDLRRIPIKGSIEEKNILEIAKELDLVRAKWGSAIGVTSWYRPARVNKEVGGVSNSQHINGSAVDIYAMNGEDDDFERFLDVTWGDRALGYGVKAGKGFTHLDLRTGGIRWNY